MFELAASAASTSIGSPATWTLHTFAHDGLLLIALVFLLRAVLDNRIRLPLPRQRSLRPRLIDQIAQSPNPAVAVREHSLRLGGGAFLGVSPTGRWVTADPEHAVLVLGPPRSGKTSSIVIPSLLAAPGAALSTSTKTDVLTATQQARSELGEIWLFDPTGEQTTLPANVRQLRWSPIAAAGTWDEALLMARAMASTSPAAHGTRHEQHWTERSTALLAPLLYAANLSNQPIATLVKWVLRSDLDPAGKALEHHHATTANDVLIGIARTDERERSSIFSATAGILAAYNSHATQTAATNPNFDANQFAKSIDTIYITAPAHKQAQTAPLIIGLLEQIRHATYKHAATSPQTPPVYFCLDEIANIAPIPDLPALISEAGGQHLHILACLQDLSQARSRWGADQAEGLLTLFQTKLILNGISDPHTLQALSTILGEYNRKQTSHTISHNEPHEWLPKTSSTESVTYNTQKHPVLNPGQIAQLPPGRALHLHGTRYKLLKLTPWHRARPWSSIATCRGSSADHQSSS